MAGGLIGTVMTLFPIVPGTPDRADQQADRQRPAGGIWPGLGAPWLSASEATWTGNEEARCTATDTQSL